MYAAHIVALERLAKTLKQKGEIEQAQNATEAAGATRKKHSSLVQTAEKLAELAKVVPAVRRKLPEGTREWNGHHYKRFNEKRISFHEAKRACEAMGGHLIILEGRPEQRFANGFAGGNTRWIGGRDESKEGSFVWLDGKAVDAKPLNSRIKSENDRDRDFLYLKDGHEIGVRTENGHQQGFQFEWVNGYICEWDY